MRVEIADGGQGRQEAVKHACEAEDAARLRREADLLNIAAHPGLVEAIGFEDGAEPVLRTLYVGESLPGLGPLAVEEVAGIVAAVATTLADLHGMGLVHGAVLPSHVLIDSDGRPVLCGLGSGGLVGERPPWSSPLAGAGDLGTGEAILTPAADVLALGKLIEFLLAQVPSKAMGAATDELRRVAEQAGASEDDRPTARQVADAVHDSVPGARLPRRGTADGTACSTGPAARFGAEAAIRMRSPLERWRRAQRPQPSAEAGRRPKWPRPAAPVAALALIAGAGTLLLRAAPDRAAPEPAAVAGTAVEGTTTTLAPAGPRSRRPAREGCPAVDGPMTADVDGDGCAEVVRFRGAVVEAAGWTWAVGEVGDVAAVGDWSCSGTRSLALLRPRTGEVFAFAGWAEAGRDLVAPLAARVNGGRSLRAADLDADGCNELVVERDSGPPAVVRPPTPSPSGTAVP